MWKVEELLWLCCTLVVSGLPLGLARFNYRVPAVNNDVFPLNINGNKKVHAVCDMEPSPDAPFNVTGTVNFVQAVTSLNYPLGQLQMRIDLQGFPTDDGTEAHGLNVHAYGDMEEGCQHVGPHYNPLKAVHGARNSPVRHVGDLGNIGEDSEGNVRLVMMDRVASLVGDNSIIGRSLVVHERADDSGLVGNEASITDGNSGKPVACCVIAYASPGGWSGLQTGRIL